MKLKFTHTTFEKVLNTVYITSFIYIFGLLITNIINYYQSNKWRVDGIGVVDFLHINETTTFIQTKNEQQQIIYINKNKYN